MSWNIKQIKENMKYLKTRYKISGEDLVGLSLNTYFEMLDTFSGNIKLYNFLDKVSKSKFSLIRESKYEKMITKSIGEDDYFDSDYFQYLLDLKDIFNDSFTEFSEINCNYLNLSLDEMIKLSKEFYLSLGNKEIYELACQVLDDNEAIDISSNKRSTYEEAGGLTFKDYIFDKAYIQVIKSNNIFDLLALNHEVMHVIDFYMQPKPSTKNYYGFHEIPTYTIDLLFCDFLEQKGFEKDDVDKLRKNRYYWLYNLASNVNMQIMSSLFSKFGFKASKATIEMKKDVVDFNIKRNLLELESGVIAYGLYKEIKENKEYGLSNLLKLLKNIFDKSTKPDFSFIGLDDNSILELSRIYLNEFKTKTK